MQKIVPHLWFDKEAEEAANFYVSVFSEAGKSAKVGKISHYVGEEAKKVSGMPEGTVLTVEFELDGQKFVALNGGPIFKFTEAVSFMVNCDSQDEIDYFWGKMSAVKESEQCGWLKDKYGLSWQIVPAELGKLMTGSPEKTEKVMNAFLKMKKLDIAELERVAGE